MMSSASVCLVATFVLMISAPVTGYRCYQCSYSLWSEGDNRECIENPDAFGRNSQINCNRTSYCVLQEVYDIGRDAVTSYFRSCSGTSWGDRCVEKGGIVTCKYSCQGDICNQNEVGRQYEYYLAQHPHRGNTWNTSALISASLFSMTLCLIMTFKLL